MSHKQSNNFIKIVGLTQVDLNFVLSFQIEELKDYSLSEDLRELDSITSLKEFINKNSNQPSTEKNKVTAINVSDDFEQTILERVRLDSENFVLNTALFTNRAYKEKVFIEILSLEEPRFTGEYEFFASVFKFITEQNFIFFVESNVLPATPNVQFTVKVLKQESVINEKSFSICNPDKNDKTDKEKESKENEEKNKDDFSMTGKATGMSNRRKIFNENSQKQSEDNLYETLQYDFNGTSYFLLDLTNLLSVEIESINSKENNNNESQQDEKSNKDNMSVEDRINSLLKKTYDLILYLFFNHPKVKKVILLPNIPDTVLGSFSSDSITLLRDIISYADIFIIEKELSELLIELLCIDSNKEVNKKNSELIFIKLLKPIYTKIPRLCLLLDSFKTLFILEQQPDTSLLLAHTSFDFNLYPDNLSNNSNSYYSSFNNKNSRQPISNIKNNSELKLYELTLKNKYFYLASVFFGGFMSRIINQKSFKTCFTAGNDSVKRVLEVLKLGIELPNDINYYMIIVPKKKKGDNRNKNSLFGENNIRKDAQTLNKESNFLLDCININECKMKRYNPLYDQSLSTFFSSFPVRKHLKTLGFINKIGEILQDPDKKRMSNLKSKKLINEYEQEEIKLLSIKENNIKMKLQIKNLFSGTIKNFQEVPIKELEKVTKVRNFKPISKQKLPSIPNQHKNLTSRDTLFAKNNNIDLYAKNVAKNTGFAPLRKTGASMKKDKINKLANSNLRHFNNTNTSNKKFNSNIDNSFNNKIINEEQTKENDNSNAQISNNNLISSNSNNIRNEKEDDLRKEEVIKSNKDVNKIHSSNSIIKKNNLKESGNSLLSSEKHKVINDDQEKISSIVPDNKSSKAIVIESELKNNVNEDNIKKISSKSIEVDNKEEVIAKVKQSSKIGLSNIVKEEKEEEEQALAKKSSSKT